MHEEWIKQGPDGNSLSAIFTVQMDNTITMHVTVLREMLAALGFEPVDTDPED